MPRYFFTIRRQDRFENGPDSAYLPDAEAALSYADYTIRGLRKKSGYEDDLSLMMIVKWIGFNLALKSCECGRDQMILIARL